jgi:hypothetical protein
MQVLVRVRVLLVEEEELVRKKRQQKLAKGIRCP